MYNYLGILSKSSAITKTLNCNFLSKDKINLVLAKGNTLEIYNVTWDGLQSTPYLNVYGKIIVLEKVPASKESIYNDSLFILTQDLDFCIIAYNKSKNEIVNLDKGSVKEDIGKRQDKVFAEFERNYEYAVISAYKNIFKVVFLKNRGKIEDFSIRYDYEELLFLFPVFTADFEKSDCNVFQRNNMESLNKFQNFSIIKLCNSSVSNISDTKTVRLETFNFNTFKSEINKDVVSYIDITNNPTVSMVLSPKVGGIVLFFSNYVKYYSVIVTMGYEKFVETDSKSYSDRKFITYCEIDKLRYLTLDEYGNLFLLAFKTQSWDNSYNNISQMDDIRGYSIILQFLGEVNYGSSITYLDNNYAFIGSDKANSQLIKITKFPTDCTNRPFIVVVEEYENLAPISDFLLLNNQSEESNTEILCVSGDQRSCCLKTLRKGTSINVESEITITGIINIFCVVYIDPSEMIIDEQNCKDNQKNLLFLSFIDKTSLISIDYQSSSIINYFSDNIIISEPTILVENFTYKENQYIIQININTISIYDERLNLKIRINTIVEPIKVHLKKKTGYLYIYNKNNIFLRYNIFDTVESVDSYPEVIFDEIKLSSFCITSDIIIFSKWDEAKIFIYSNRTKKTNVLCDIDENTFCPSLEMIKSEGFKYLFVGLSNDNLTKNLPLYTYTAEDFIFKRKYNMSNSLFDVRKVRCQDRPYLFINTDLPALVYINKESLNISNFNIKDCDRMINLRQNSYAFLFKDAIIIGNLSNSESQNVVTKNVGNKIYNLSADLGNGVICYVEEEKNDQGSRFSLVSFDQHLNELSRYKFENEKEVCLTFLIVNDSNLVDSIPKCHKMIILGTGIIHNPVEEPNQGHLFFLSMDQNFNFTKIGEIETHGGVYKIVGNKNLIFVAICSTLFVYSVEYNTKKGLECKLLRKSSDFTIINDLYCHDNYILVSDICKSVILFKFEEEKEKLVEVCRDFNSVWCSAMTKVEENIYIISDIDGNFFTLRKESNPKCDEDKFKFERISQFNLGEKVNKLVTIEKNINSRDWEHIFENSESKIEINKTDNQKNKIKITYFATVEGSLGILAHISKETFEYLSLLQNEILKVICSTGNFDYEKWRAFKDGFISDFSKNFVDGAILQEFLNFDNNYRVEFLKNLRYPWQKKTKETIELIEALVKLH